MRMGKKRAIKRLLLAVGLIVILVSFFLKEISVVEHKEFIGFIPPEAQAKCLDIGHLESNDQIRFWASFTDYVMLGISTVSQLLLHQAMQSAINEHADHIFHLHYCVTNLVSSFTASFPEVYAFLIVRIKKNVSVFYSLICNVIVFPYDVLQIPFLTLGCSLTCSSILSLLTHQDAPLSSKKTHGKKPTYIC